ncbi:MAG: lipopolysaccharide heptosyltransferase II [Deltaproteobacteria bacterium]|nr:MAG: lipopolysaccharide heptosyltransferase II [Deltaproteobacteria bacterium]
MNRKSRDKKNSHLGQLLAPSILVVRLSSLGDVLLTTPVLRALRQKWPGARISFLTKEEFAPLLHNNPHLDEVITTSGGGTFEQSRDLVRKLRYRKWDLLVDLHRSLRSFLFRRLVPAARTVVYSKYRLKRTLLIYTRLDLYPASVPLVPERYVKPLEPFGVKLDEGPCELFLDESDREPALKKISARWPSSPPLLAVAPGSAWPIKRWPVESFAESARELALRFGFKVILLGSKKDAEICARLAQILGQKLCLDLAGKLPIRGSAAAVAEARLLLTNDTGLMHIATAVGTPVVAVFGPTTRHFGYFPYRAESRVVETRLYCRPCTHNGRVRCPLGHFRCMKDIKAERVVEAAVELLNF